MDIFLPEKRSSIMKSIASRDTEPEMMLEKLLRQAHIRYRKHVITLPGTPDFFLPNHNVAVFVHGCFWHGHSNCRRATLPSTRRTFWARKIATNTRRDRLAARKLREAGLRVFTIWTCRPRRMQQIVDTFRSPTVARAGHRR
jgi:DNA mismatch endonuclease (patch repair protein)